MHEPSRNRIDTDRLLRNRNGYRFFIMPLLQESVQSRIWDHYHRSGSVHLYQHTSQITDFRAAWAAPTKPQTLKQYPQKDVGCIRVPGYAPSHCHMANQESLASLVLLPIAVVEIVVVLRGVQESRSYQKIRRSIKISTKYQFYS